MQGAIAHVDSGALGNITHAHYRNAHYAAYGRWFAARGRSRPASNGAMVSNVYAHGQDQHSDDHPDAHGEQVDIT